jgi:hypothetical protein
MTEPVVTEPNTSEPHTTDPAATPGVAADRIGWPRAIASGLAIVVVGFVAAVGGANYILTGFNGTSRDTKAYLASALFLVVVVVMAWALRRLQARGLI